MKTQQIFIYRKNLLLGDRYYGLCQNPSELLEFRLNDTSPNSLHVQDVEIAEAIDPIVWDYAKFNDWRLSRKIQICTISA
jgi:hypothetical protein